jgi:transcriptional regulator with GAF, ATPase, and Fis domain
MGAMVARRRAKRAEGMSLEAQLWREVCQHLELEESVQRVFAILAEHVCLDALVIRRLERDPMRLATIAVGGSQPAGTTSARSAVNGRAANELTGLLANAQPTLLKGGRAALAEVLAPEAKGHPLIALPLIAQGAPVGVAVLVLRAGEQVTPKDLEILAPATRPLGVAFENDQRLHELARMRAALEADRAALLSRLHRDEISEAVIGESGGLATVMERVEQVARTDAPVLILGATGSGKELIARAIHTRSQRSKGPVVRVNCGAIPSELVDSELFGHEKGAFTGATGTRKGWFERADGELSLAAQVRLLRVLQDGTLERVGGHQTINVDVRVVAATHRNLEAMVGERSFREDLWYRLSVFPIRLPALRERMEDLPALATHFADRAGKRLGGTGLAPTATDLELLRAYAWPGNVRELAAVIDRAAILGSGKRLDVRTALGATSMRAPSLPPPGPAQPPTNGGGDPRHIATLDAAMAEHIQRALEACHGRIEGPFGAAKVLGINPHTLRARMRKLGVEWSQFREASHLPTSTATS